MPSVRVKNSMSTPIMFTLQTPNGSASYTLQPTKGDRLLELDFDSTILNKDSVIVLADKSVRARVKLTGKVTRTLCFSEKTKLQKSYLKSVQSFKIFASTTKITFLSTQANQDAA